MEGRIGFSIGFIEEMKLIQKIEIDYLVMKRGKEFIVTSTLEEDLCVDTKT